MIIVLIIELFIIMPKKRYEKIAKSLKRHVKMQAIGWPEFPNVSYILDNIFEEFYSVFCIEIFDEAGLVSISSKSIKLP